MVRNRCRHSSQALTPARGQQGRGTRGISHPCPGCHCSCFAPWLCAEGVIMPARKRLARISLFSITACTLPSRLPGGPWLTCLLSIICF